MYERNIYCYNNSCRQTLMIDIIIIVVSSIDILILFLTVLPHIQWFYTCCSVVQIRNEGLRVSATKQGSNNNLTCVSLSKCGFCRSSFKWPIKTGFIVYPVSSRSFLFNDSQVGIHANVFFKVVKFVIWLKYQQNISEYLNWYFAKNVIVECRVQRMTVGEVIFLIAFT